jgi:hypothetical protein
MLSALIFFWVWLAVAFGALAIYTYRVKHVMLPKWFEESHHREAFSGVDIEKIRPLFNHMLTIEIIAFILSAVAALVTFLTS